MQWSPPLPTQTSYFFPMDYTSFAKNIKNRITIPPTYINKQNLQQLWISTRNIHHVLGITILFSPHVTIQKRKSIYRCN